MEEEIKNGCLGLGHTSKDWIMDGNSVKLDSLPELYIKDDVRIEYNQGSSNDCTIYGTIGAISDLFNYTFTPEEITEINEESYKRGRVRGEGWYVQSAVRLVCEWWNERHKDKTVAFYYISKYETDVIEKVLNKNYTLVSGYYGSSAYKRDRDDNLQIDNSDWGKSTYGHCIDVLLHKGKKGCKDSYKGRTANGKDSNYYNFIPDFGDCDNWHFGFYLIVQEDEAKIEDIKRLNKFKEKVELMIKTNSEMRELTNDVTFRDELHAMNNSLRKKLDDILHELSKY